MEKDDPQATERFSGWAIVEIMGHQRIAGFTQSKAFGSTVMFHVTAPEVPEVERTLERDEYLSGHILGKGSRVATGRPRLSTYVGAGSVYRLTECTEEQALRANPLTDRIVERVERQATALVEAAETFVQVDDDIPC